MFILYIIINQIHYQAWDREKSKKEENCYMWGSAATEPPGGGFGRGVPPPAENFAILGTENHVLMHFRTTFWGYNVDYLLCLVTLQLKIFFFFFLRMSKSAEIRGSAEKSHACTIQTFSLELDLAQICWAGIPWKGDKPSTRLSIVVQRPLRWWWGHLLIQAPRGLWEGRSKDHMLEV